MTQQVVALFVDACGAGCGTGLSSEPTGAKVGAQSAGVVEVVEVAQAVARRLPTPGMEVKRRICSSNVRRPQGALCAWRRGTAAIAAMTITGCGGIAKPLREEIIGFCAHIAA